MFECLTRARITKYTLTFAQVCYLCTRKVLLKAEAMQKRTGQFSKWLINKGAYSSMNWIQAHSHISKENIEIRNRKKNEEVEEKASKQLNEEKQIENGQQQQQLKHWKTFKRNTGKEWKEDREGGREKESEKKSGKLKDMATTGGGHFL